MEILREQSWSVTWIFICMNMNYSVQATDKKPLVHCHILIDISEHFQHNANQLSAEFWLKNIEAKLTRDRRDKKRFNLVF